MGFVCYDVALPSQTFVGDISQITDSYCASIIIKSSLDVRAPRSLVETMPIVSPTPFLWLSHCIPGFSMCPGSINGRWPRVTNSYWKWCPSIEKISQSFLLISFSRVSILYPWFMIQWNSYITVWTMNQYEQSLSTIIMDHLYCIPSKKNVTNQNWIGNRTVYSIYIYTHVFIEPPMYIYMYMYIYIYIYVYMCLNYIYMCVYSSVFHGYYRQWNPWSIDDSSELGSHRLPPEPPTNHRLNLQAL